MTNNIIIINGPNLNLLGEREQSQYGSITFEQLKQKSLFKAKELNVNKVELDELMQQSDFITVHCPLNEHTRDIISYRELDLMKSSSFIINTARGGIINEDALYAALSKNHIAGAALDCFNNEPIIKPHRFGELENVMLAPHSIAWTQELFRDMGKICSKNLIDISNGIRPNGVVNPEVFDRHSFQKKWDNLIVNKIK